MKRQPFSVCVYVCVFELHITSTLAFVSVVTWLCKNAPSNVFLSFCRKECKEKDWGRSSRRSEGEGGYYDKEDHSDMRPSFNHTYLFAHSCFSFYFFIFFRAAYGESRVYFSFLFFFFLPRTCAGQDIVAFPLES